MAFRFKIIRLISIFIALSFAGLATAEENAYISAYGKAVDAYSHWYMQKSREGKKPTQSECIEMHKTLFAEADSQYSKQVDHLHKRLTTIGKEMMKNVLSGENAKPLASTSPGEEKTEEKSESSPSRSVASVNGDSGRNKTAGDVKSGTAESVVFQKSATQTNPSVWQIKSPSLPSSSDSAGAVNVNFSNTDRKH